MAENLVINETTYPEVEAITAQNEDGDPVAFYPDAVRYKEQALTKEQQAQARENIGAASQEAVSNLSEEIDDYETLTLGTNPADGLLYIYKKGNPIGVGVETSTGTVDSDVVGYVDSNNNIILTGDLLEEGNYTLKYEKANGELVEIGSLEFDVINYINLVPTSVTSDGVTIYGDDHDSDGKADGYRNNIRLRTNGIEEATLTGYCASGFIPVVKNDVIRVKGVTFKDDYTKAVGYDSGFATHYSQIDKGTGEAQATYFDVALEADGVVAFTVKQSYIAWVRFGAYGSGENMIITKNQVID